MTVAGYSSRFKRLHAENLLRLGGGGSAANFKYINNGQSNHRGTVLPVSTKICRTWSSISSLVKVTRQNKIGYVMNMCNIPTYYVYIVLRTYIQTTKFESKRASRERMRRSKLCRMDVKYPWKPMNNKELIYKEVNIHK